MAKQARAARTDRRARILDAATEAFLECGFEVASTAEIARRAKVSKRELYTHFRDKRDILAAVITELQADIQSKANVSWSSSGDVREVLRQAGTDLLRFINSERFGKLFRIVAAESFHDPVSSRKFYLLGPAMGRKNTAAFLKVSESSLGRWYYDYLERRQQQPAGPAVKPIRQLGIDELSLKKSTGSSSR